MNAQNTPFTTVMQFHGSNIAFEEINGKTMINATQMAKPFGKKPKDWLRTQQAKELLDTVSKRHICPLSDLQEVTYGGSNNGTWFQEDVALFFAQWLSPEFYLACNDKLKELLKQQAIALPNKYGIPATVHNGEVLYPYTEACKTLGGIKYPKASVRKRKNPQHFKWLFGRNFITEAYLQALKGYYDYKKMSNQLKLAI